MIIFFKEPISKWVVFYKYVKFNFVFQSVLYCWCVVVLGRMFNKLSVQSNIRNVELWQPHRNTEWWFFAACAIFDRNITMTRTEFSQFIVYSLARKKHLVSSVRRFLFCYRAVKYITLENDKLKKNYRDYKFWLATTTLE